MRVLFCETVNPGQVCKIVCFASLFFADAALFVNNRRSRVPKFGKFHVSGVMPVDTILECPGAAMNVFRFGFGNFVDERFRLGLKFWVFSPNTAST